MSINAILVGMADLNVVKDPGKLTTLGLGSCVGICLWDPSSKVSGMAHCMLPDSASIANNTNVAKFVDSALIRLINDMVRAGANKNKIKAKLAGGAQMFAFNSTNESMRIGDRNVEAALRRLREMGIPLIGRDTGEDYGRTIELYTDDGRVVIKTIGRGLKTI
ncbi:MAG: chemotaxis protein CheD [Defluviitaleaceae bacterium]|nr:chemotaxis protein CheD [Defluviitaleaceae bacterium]